MPPINPQSPQPFPLNQRTVRITPTSDGLFGECGSGGSGSAGWWTFQFVPDLTFAGTLVVMGRIAGPDATADGVPMVAIPYLALYLNGQIVTPTLGAGGLWTTAPITGTSLFQVPTAALSAGVVISCSAGFGNLYTLDALAGG